MPGINIKPVSTTPAASMVPKSAMSTSVWRDKLETARHVETLANLLQSTGIINGEQYCEAIEIADSLRKSVDQVIFTSFLSEQQREICAGAMSYLERGIVNEELAANGLKFANDRGLTFAEGLRYFGFGW